MVNFYGGKSISFRFSLEYSALYCSATEDIKGGALPRIIWIREGTTLPFHHPSHVNPSYYLTLHTSPPPQHNFHSTPPISPQLNHNSHPTPSHLTPPHPPLISPSLRHCKYFTCLEVFGKIFPTESISIFHKSIHFMILFQ